MKSPKSSKLALVLLPLALLLPAFGTSSTPIRAALPRGLRSAAFTPAAPEAPALALDLRRLRESPRPALADWRAAAPLALAHDSCRALQLREWVMIRCASWGVTAVHLLAGQKSGVDAWIKPDDWERDIQPEAVLVFPVRPGDRRLFQVTGRSRYSSFAMFMVTEHWPEDEPAPTLLIH